MASVIIYSGIGVFNPSGTLIAQGSQQIKFTGSVSVGIVADQTVVNIGGGGSVTGDPNTLAFFDGTGTIADTLGARFLTTRTLGFHATLTPFPANLVFSDSLIFGSLNAGGSSAVLGATANNVFSNGVSICTFGASGSLRNSSILGTSHTLSPSDIWSNILVSGNLNTISLGLGAQPNSLVILGKSNSFSPTTLGNGANSIIGNSNSVITWAPNELKVIGSNNATNVVNTGYVGDGNHLIVGYQNTFLATDRALYSSAIFGINNLIKNNTGSGATSGILSVIGYGNTLDARGNTDLHIFGSNNYLDALGTGINKSTCFGSNNYIQIRGGGSVSEKNTLIGYQHYIDAAKVTNSSISGGLFYNGSNAVSFDKLTSHGYNNQVTNTNNLSESVILGNDNLIAGAATFASGIFLCGIGLQAASFTNVSVLGRYNDVSDTSYNMVFGAGSSGSTFNAFGVKANNKSVDLKITNIRPSAGIVAANNLTVNASLVELTASYTINNFDLGINDGQILTIRQLDASTSTINPNANVLTPGTLPISLTENSAATFIWSNTKSAWTLTSLVLY